MRKIILFSLCLLAALPVYAQGGLSSDQRALLDAVHEALNGRDGWASYSESSGWSSSFALTILGEETQSWETKAVYRDVVADFDLASERATGSITYRESLASSDAENSNQREQLAFVVVADSVFVGETPAELAAIRRLNDYAQFDLPALVDLDAPFQIQADLLDNATAVFDLGVSRNSRRQRIQRYEIALDFARSQRQIGFNMDGFVRQFDGLVATRALRDALQENATLTLLVGVNAQTEQLAELTLVLDVFVELPGADGAFSLEYGQHYSSSYYNINEAFEIETPEG